MMPTVPNDLRDQIVNQDCVAGMSRLPDGCVDLVFADPPFNIGYQYDVYDDRRAVEDYRSWCAAWMQQIFRVLKPDGTFWLMIGDEMAAELKCLANLLGFRSRGWVVWYYTFGVNSARKLTRSHAHIFYFVKDPKRFTFNVDEVRIPSARLIEYNDKRANPDGRLPDDTWIIRPDKLAEGFPADGTIWQFSRVAGTFAQREEDAANQLPEQLLARIMRLCSNQGEFVLDPFAGTGTWAAVAKKLGRSYLSFELSGPYAARCLRRLALVSPGDPLQGTQEPRDGRTPDTGIDAAAAAAAVHPQAGGGRGRRRT